MRPPRPKARFPVNPEKENTLFLFWSVALSASKALAEEEKAASDTPSKRAAASRMNWLSVSAKTAIVRLATILPKIRIFLLLNLSARIPNGMLDATIDTPIMVIKAPMNPVEMPLT